MRFFVQLVVKIGSLENYMWEELTYNKTAMVKLAKKNSVLKFVLLKRLLETIRSQKKTKIVLDRVFKKYFVCSEKKLSD